MPLRSLAALIALATLTACGEPQDTGPGQPVAHRRAAFQAILKAFEPISAAVRKNQYAPDEFIKQAERLNQVKDGPWPYFTPESNYPPTRATDKVWAEPEKFAESRQAFLQAAEGLLEASRSRNEEKVRAAYEVLHQTCRDCHKAFRK